MFPKINIENIFFIKHLFVAHLQYEEYCEEKIDIKNTIYNDCQFFFFLIFVQHFEIIEISNKNTIYTSISTWKRKKSGFKTYQVPIQQIEKYSYICEAFLKEKYLAFLAL